MFFLYSEDLLQFVRQYNFDPQEFPSVFQLYQQVSFIYNEATKLAEYEENINFESFKLNLKSYLDYEKIFYPFVIEYLRRSEFRISQSINNLLNKDNVTIFLI